jgi:hypothetical protein
MPLTRHSRRIILHAGFHKTGTTSLQANLRGNAKLLLPQWRIQTSDDTYSLRATAKAARDYSISRDPADLAMVAAQTVLWLAEMDLRPDDQLLASTEDFAGHMPGRFGVLDYSAAVDILHAVIELAGQFYKGAVTFEVIFTTRAPGAWLRSLYFQQAKHPDLTLDFDTFCATIPKAADHAGVVRKVRRKLGDVPVHLFALEDLSIRRLGPAEAVYDIAGLPDALRAKLLPTVARNVTPDVSLADAFVAANRLGLPRNELNKLKDDLLLAAVPLGRKLR